MWQAIVSFLLRLCTVGALFAFSASTASAEYLLDWELRAFIKSVKLQGRTIKDGDRWYYIFWKSGEFKFRIANQRSKSGVWRVSGREIHLKFQTGQRACKMIFVSFRRQLEWQDCATGYFISHVVSPTYDPNQYAGLNARKANEEAQVLGAIRDLAGTIIKQNDDSGKLDNVLALVDQYLLDPIIRNLLSKAGQAAHADAIRRSSKTGQTVNWDLGTESGTATPLGEVYVNASGHSCRKIDEDVRVMGRHKAEREGTYCWDENGSMYPVG